MRNIARIRLLSVLLLVAMAQVSQTTVAVNVHYFFLSEPGKVFPLLTSQMKNGLLQYHRAADKATRVDNTIGGETALEYSDSVYLRVRSSEAKTVEIRMFFPSKRDTVLAVIATYLLPSADSKITFYDSEWREVEAKRYINLLGPEGFLVKGTPKEIEEEMKDKVPFGMMKLEFKGDKHDVIVAEPSLKTFLTEDDYNRLKPYLNEKVYYTLNGKKFTLSKQYLK